MSQISLEDRLLSVSDLSRQLLSEILKDIKFVKDLTLEPKIVKPLERICGVSWLRDNEVEKIYKLSDSIHKYANHLAHVFLIYSDVRTVEKVLDQINSILSIEEYSRQKDGQFHIICVPKVFHSFTVLLEEQGLYGIVNLHSWQWQPIALDSHVLSLELPQVFAETFINCDTSYLPVLARAVWSLVVVCGSPETVVALGKYAKIVMDQLEFLSKTYKAVKNTRYEIGALLILDRSTDFVSPILTPATYSGLLDEICAIRAGFVEKPAVGDGKYDEKGNPVSQKQQNAISIDSLSDEVYPEIKNKHFTDVTAFLKNQVLQLRSESEIRKNMGLSEMKAYVSTQLQKVTTRKKVLLNHLDACEIIGEMLGRKFERLKCVEELMVTNSERADNLAYVESFICTENNHRKSLRLMSLLSITQKLTPDEYENLKGKFLQEFGYKYLHAFYRMTSLGLIEQSLKTFPHTSVSIPNISSNRFQAVASRFRQIPKQQKGGGDIPQCPSLVFGSIYIPLVCQLVAAFLQCNNEKEFAARLDIFEHFKINSEFTNFTQNKTVLVCFVGGISHAEIAACGIAEKLTGCKIVLLSDNIISGNSLMDDVC